MELQTFSFDAVGDRTAQDPAGTVGATSYGYDQASRLTHYEAPAPDPGDPDVQRGYSYDGDGLRSDLLWDGSGGLPLVVGDSAGLYVSGPDGLPLAQLSFDGQQRYYHHDQLGSTRALSGADGAVIARYGFDPYGNHTAGSGTIDSRFGYAGQYTDRASGLIYMRARWYDPKTAAFLTSDPIGHASGETNLYRYSAGDPTNLIDPTGLILGIPGTPSAQDISNFAAGMGDTTSLGITSRIRQGLGIDNVDRCSRAYRAGGITALAVEAGTIAAGAAKTIGKIGIRKLGKRLSDETGSIGLGARGARRGPATNLMPTGKAGRLHGDVPNSPRGLSQDELGTLQDQLEHSIAVRHDELLALGNKGWHGQRLAQEARLLRQVNKAMKDG